MLRGALVEWYCVEQWWNDTALETGVLGERCAQVLRYPPQGSCQLLQPTLLIPKYTWLCIFQISLTYHLVPVNHLSLASSIHSEIIIVLSVPTVKCHITENINFQIKLIITQLSVSLLNWQCWMSAYLHDQSEVRLRFARYEVLTVHWIQRHYNGMYWHVNVT